MVNQVDLIELTAYDAFNGVHDLLLTYQGTRH